MEMGLIVVFWASFYLMTVARDIFDERASGGSTLADLKELLFSVGALEPLFWMVLTPGIFWLARRYNFEGGKTATRLILHLGLAFVVAVFLDYALHEMRVAMDPNRHKSGEFLYRILPNISFADELFLYLFILASGVARDYFIRYQERQRESAFLLAQAAELRAHSTALQVQLADARLRTLRMQLNPHFLFNTLHTISSYVTSDPSGARHMIARLSDLLRHSLQDTDATEVPLMKEMVFVDNYLELQEIRFADRLEVVRKIEPDVREALVPNMILQPIIENALKHGIAEMDTGGIITISARRRGARLHLAVTDNGTGLPAGTDIESLMQKGIGLRNTRERLESLYESDHELTISAREAGGTTVQIVLPFHTSSDLFTSEWSGST